MAVAKLDQNSRPTLTALSNTGDGSIVVLWADPTTHRLLVDDTGASSSPLTTKGDIYTYSTTNTRLPVGTNGQVLSADNTTATGLKWVAVSGTGDVVGPAGATSGNIAVFNGATGKLIADGGIATTAFLQGQNGIFSENSVGYTAALSGDLQFSMAFTLTTSMTITQALFWAGRNNTVGNAFCKIYAATGVIGVNAKPTGAVLAQSDAYDTTAWTGTTPVVSPSTFNFTGANQVTFAPGTYCVTVETASNQFFLDRNNSSAVGFIAYADGGAWTNYTGKFKYMLVGTPTSIAGQNTGDQYGDGTTITGSGTMDSPFTLAVSYVPYTGATTDLNLGTHKLFTDYWYNAANTAHIYWDGFVFRTISDFAANTFTSSAGVGMAPFACTSTTLNTNLNADLLDGNHATAFQTANANLTTIAGLTATTGNIIQSVGSAWTSQTPTQVTASLNAMTGDSGSGGLKGLVPAQATGDATKVLSGAGTWIAAGGTGTVTTVSVTTANGVSGTVATATTTPAITLTLGAITPTSVNNAKLKADTNGNVYFSSAAIPSPSGLLNMSIGSNALVNVTSGNNNVAMGAGALNAVTTTDNNVAVGKYALSATTGGSSVALGYSAGTYETGGNAFYVDNQDRTNTAGDKAGALLYGTFNATPASQTLKVNGTLSATAFGTINGNTISVGTGTLSLSSYTLTVANTASVSGTNTGDNATNSTYTTLATTLGTANTWTNVQTFTNSDVRLLGSSTGYTTFTSANASASNYTLTLPAVTDTIVTLTATQTLTNKRVTPRILSATSYTTDTGSSLNADNYDMFIVTAQAGALKFNNPGGTPTDGQKLIITVASSTTAARALTWDTAYGATTVALPTTTAATTATLTIGFIWSASKSLWQCVAVA